MEFFEDHHAEKQSEQSIQSFLLKVLKFSGGVAAGIYRVEAHRRLSCGVVFVPGIHCVNFSRNKNFLNLISKTLFGKKLLLRNPCREKNVSHQAVKAVRFG